MKPGSSYTTRVFIVDEHEVLRRGVAAILTGEDGITVVGDAGSVNAALLRIPTVKPDVVILGAPDHGDGITLCSALRTRTPDLRCLMLISTTDQQEVVAAFMAGAAGVVDNTITATDLVAAVRTVGSGRSLLDRDVATKLLARIQAAAPTPGPFSELTDVEHRVLDLIGEGLSNREIAARMFVADKTVKNYVSRVLAKLHMGSRTQAAIAVTTTHLGGLPHQPKELA